MMAAMGRPSIYTPEIAAVICERLANGESLRQICAADDMPGRSTVFRWAAENVAFRDQYAVARAAQAEHMADELLDIADDGSNDWMERFYSEGQSLGWQVNGEHIQRSRLRVDSRKWLLSKLLPKKYGDAIRQELTGPNGGPIETRSVVELSDEDLARIAAGVSK